MDIYISKDGQQSGPYSKKDLTTYLSEGSFSGSDLVWSEGMPEWIPISSFYTAPLPRPANRPAPAPSPATTAVSPTQSPSGVTQQPIDESRKKSAGLACFLNFMLPGAGYIYAGMLVKGLVVLGAWIACLCLFFLVIPLYVAGLISILATIDGYLAVGRSNRKLAE